MSRFISHSHSGHQSGQINVFEYFSLLSPGRFSSITTINHYEVTESKYIIYNARLLVCNRPQNNQTGTDTQL